jgi:hypothetical protein
MKAAVLRTVEILLAGAALLWVIPPISSDGEDYPLFPRLAIAGTLYAVSLGLSASRKGENALTACVKFGGFLAFGWALHVRCGFA